MEEVSFPIEGLPREKMDAFSVVTHILIGVEVTKSSFSPARGPQLHLPVAVPVSQLQFFSREITISLSRVKATTAPFGVDAARTSRRDVLRALCG